MTRLSKALAFIGASVALFSACAFSSSAAGTFLATYNGTYTMAVPVRTSDGVFVMGAEVPLKASSFSVYTGNGAEARGSLSFSLPTAFYVRNFETETTDVYNVSKYCVGNGYDNRYDSIVSVTNSNYRATVNGSYVSVSCSGVCESHSDWCGWWLSNSVIPWFQRGTPGTYVGNPSSPVSPGDPMSDSGDIVIFAVLDVSSSELYKRLDSIDKNVSNIWGAINGDYPEEGDIPSQPDGLEDYTDRTEEHLQDSQKIDDSVSAWVDGAKIPTADDLSPELSNQFGADGFSSPPDISDVTVNEGWSGFLDGLYWLWTIHPMIYTMLSLLLGFVLLTIYLRGWGIS